MVLGTFMVPTVFRVLKKVNAAMSVIDSLIAFTLAATLLTLTPGLDTALILRTAAVEGRSQAFKAAFGINTGCLIWGLPLLLALGH
jgi:threonine/homoserine/homoserine lactone efflux protein